MIAVLALCVASWSVVRTEHSSAAWPVGAFTEFPADTPVDREVDHGYFDPGEPEGESPVAQSSAPERVSPTRIWVVNSGGIEPIALLQSSPWLGCRVVVATAAEAVTFGHTPPEGFETGFLDPCHGGLFSLTGDHLAGPGTRGLSRFPVGIDADGTVLVDMTHLIPG